MPICNTPLGPLGRGCPNLSYSEGGECQIDTPHQASNVTVCQCHCVSPNLNLNLRHRVRNVSLKVPGYPVHCTCIGNCTSRFEGNPLNCGKLGYPGTQVPWYPGTRVPRVPVQQYSTLLGKIGTMVLGIPIGSIWYMSQGFHLMRNLKKVPHLGCMTCT